MTAEQIELVRGQDLDVVVTVYGACNEPTPDLTIHSCEFLVAGAVSEAPVHSAPVTTAGNVLTAKLARTFTETLSAGEYYFTVWIESLGERRRVARGSIIVEDDPRNY